MQIFNELLDHSVLLPCQQCVFTFGSFDGVHVGHKHLFDKVKAYAKEHKIPSAVLTFSNQPREVLSPDFVPSKLTSSSEKLALIESYQFDVVVEIQFTKQFANLSAEEFFSKISTMIPPAVWIVGEDVSFGKERRGGRAFLEAKAKENGFVLEILEKVTLSGETVSSSAIRKAIFEADFEKAKQFLGRSYVQVARLKSVGDEFLVFDLKGYAYPKKGMYISGLLKPAYSLDEKSTRTCSCEKKTVAVEVTAIGELLLKKNALSEDEVALVVSQPISRFEFL